MTTCPYCEKQGLPILPLRYAIARSDLGDAPELVAPFGDGVTTIALPKAQAHYTLRLLRAGYVYVYDERYEKLGAEYCWTGYQVDGQGYLYPFDAVAVGKGGTHKRMAFWLDDKGECSRKSEHAMAGRCITIRDADSAKTIWLAFSDVVWTESVLNDNAKASYRKAHMRSVDMSKVCKGTNQSHASKLTELGKHVAEYATTPKALAAETRPYLKKLLPTPFKSLEEWNQFARARPELRKSRSGLLLTLAPGAMADTQIKQTGGLFASAAWEFSAQSLCADADIAGAMEAWADEAAGTLEPGMVALNDPAGIAMELNGLIQQRTAEFTEARERKWKHDTASTIKMFQHAIESGAIEADNRHGNSAIYAPTKEAFEQQLGEMREGAWHPYAKLMKPPETSARDEHGKSLNAADEAIAAYQKEWSAYEKANDLSELDQGWLAWVQAKPFTDYFTHAYDRNNLACGAVFCEVLGAVMSGLLGRTAIASYLFKAMAADPLEKASLWVRGLALNHDQLVADWVAGAQQAHGKTINEAIETGVVAVYGAWSALMGGDANHYHGLARYVHRLSGTLLDRLGNRISAMMSNMPRKLTVTMLGALARLENPGTRLVDLSAAVTSAQRAKLLNRVLGEVLGEGGMHESAVSRYLLSKKAQTMDALVLIDETKLKRWNEGHGSLNAALSHEQLEEAITSTLPKLKVTGEAAGSVVGMVVGIATFRSTLQSFKTAQGEVFWREGSNLFSQVTSLSGASFDAAGAAIRGYRAFRMGAQLETGAGRTMAAVEWLSGAGRILGGVGGILGGLVSIWQGVDNILSGHTMLGWSGVAVGALSIVGGIALLVGAFAVGLVFAVVVFLLMLLIAYFKQDAVQNWIEKTSFGDGGLPPFSDWAEQQLALQKLPGE